MPSDREDCFLFFIRGGCAEDTPLFPLRQCVPSLMAELKQKAKDRGNIGNPDLAVRTGREDGDSWYDHGQLSRSRCTCRLNFGGEGKAKTSTKTQPVDCQGLVTGKMYEAVLLTAMRRNTLSGQPRPVYLDKAFHALLNAMDHRKMHRLAFHSDKFAVSYVPQDPITSLSWGCTGVLVLRPYPKKQGKIHLIVAMHGDVTVMGGCFQENFQHAVPPVSDWPALLLEHGADLEVWERHAMECEIRSMSESSNPLPRQNSTIRWHDTHSGCHWSNGPVDISSGSMLTVAESIERFTQATQAHPSNPGMPFKLGTGFLSFASLPPTAAVTACSGATLCGNTQGTQEMLARTLQLVAPGDLAAVPQTAPVTGCSGATSCGNTQVTPEVLAPSLLSIAAAVPRTDPQTSCGNPLATADTMPRTVRMLDQAVQTEEQIPPCSLSHLLFLFKYRFGSLLRSWFFASGFARLFFHWI